MLLPLPRPRTVTPHQRNLPAQVAYHVRMRPEAETGHLLGAAEPVLQLGSRSHVTRPLVGLAAPIHDPDQEATSRIIQPLFCAWYPR